MALSFHFQSFQEKVPKHNQPILYFNGYEGITEIKAGFSFYEWRNHNGALFNYEPEFADNKEYEKEGYVLWFCIQNLDDNLSKMYCEVSELPKQFPDIFWMQDPNAQTYTPE